MIDLNKRTISKESLLKYIDDVDVYTFYSNEDVEINKVTLSPLREEHRPSFGYFLADDGNEILFKDFVRGGGDFIKFVQLLYDLPYYDAMSKIAIDFGLDDKFIVKPMPKHHSKPSSKINKKDVLKNRVSITLQKRRRRWKAHDLAYWTQFGITRTILEKYNVEPIDYIFINSNPIKADKFAYCFIEYKDNNETYKIYQPYSEEYKWRTNHNHSIWQGWCQLPEQGDTLIITKSLKDVMSIVSTTNYASVALQAESVKPKDHVVDQLKERFKNIYLLYDNDYNSEVNWGQKFAIDIIHKYNIENIFIPTVYECKDYSDLWKSFKQKSVKILEEAIKNSLPF